MFRPSRLHVFCVLVAVFLIAPLGWNSTVAGRGLGDAYEPDDSYLDASDIMAGWRQQHDFHVDGDEDWVAIPVTAGRQFTIYTSRLGIDVDTVIELYDTDGTTLLDENDDGGADLWSRLVYTATSSGSYFLRVRQYGGIGTGQYLLTLERDPGIYLDKDTLADVFTYNPANGDWAIESNDGSGGFTETPGNWAPGLSVSPGSFDSDGMTDFFVIDPATGDWEVMLNDGSGGFYVQAAGSWWPGWQRYIMQLDDDGLSDVFLYDPATGVWFKCISNGSGFDYEQGGWNPGWEIHPARLNVDQMDDIFLIDRNTGRWFWVMSDPTGFYYPVSETWFNGWNLHIGDFNGDGVDDFLLHDPPTGTYFVVYTGDLVFKYFQGGWSLGWVPYVADLNADGSDDLFLHDPATGVWFFMLSDGAGDFTNAGGETWSLGWVLDTTNLSDDGMADAFLYDFVSGVWYQAINAGSADFKYFSGTWAPGLQVFVRSGTLTPT